MVASLLALVLFSSQITSLSAQPLNPLLNPSQEQTVAFSDTSVPTIRLAQVDPAPDTRPGWAGEIDINPPVIDHEALETGTPGEPQKFSAIVIDDRGLTHVVLYHRDRSGAQYSSVEMEQTAGTSGQYTATIETSAGQNSVEYYIEALDTGGNRVLKGFPFFPLVRQLEPLPAAPVEVTETTGPDKRLIYVLLGVAAVGLAAVALSGGDSGEPEGDIMQPMVPTVPINITVTPPSQ